MIRRTEAGDYVISSRGRWLPGVYEDERTARWAFHFSDADLQRLQNRAGMRAVRVITHEDLSNLQRENQLP